MVSAVDEAVGNIIEALETTGVKWGWGSIVLILTLTLLTVKRFYTSMVLNRIRSSAQKYFDKEMH